MEFLWRSVLSDLSLYIFVVDDYCDISEMLVCYLVKNGLCVMVVENVVVVCKVLKVVVIDFVVFDIMMLGEDGLLLCWYLVEIGLMLVILLIVMVDDMDWVIGLEIGVDDYVMKLFNF